MFFYWNFRLHPPMEEGQQPKVSMTLFSMPILLHSFLSEKNWLATSTLHFYSLGFYPLFCDPVMHFLFFVGSPHPRPWSPQLPRGFSQTQHYCDLNSRTKMRLLSTGTAVFRKKLIVLWNPARESFYRSSLLEYWEDDDKWMCSFALGLLYLV